MKKKLSLLFTIGLFLFLMFSFSTLLSMKAINSIYTSIYMNETEIAAKKTTDYVRNELKEYAALTWLLNYWGKNYASMDIPINGLQDKAWLAAHEVFHNANVKNISVAEAQTFSPTEQKKVAEICYLLIASFFDTVQRDFDLFGINCFVYLGNERAFAFFKTGYNVENPDSYPLGELMLFTPELHPVAKKIIETGKEVSGIERATSKLDGIEYIFVPSPLSLNGELDCMIYQAIIWNNVKEKIEAGAMKIGNFIFLLLFVAFALLMTILYRIVIRPLSLVQKDVWIFENEKDSKMVLPDLEKIAKVPNEIGSLAFGISNMICAIDRYVEEVRTITAEKERVSTELSLATKIQKDSLPNVFPAFPNRKEFDIYATMTPAKEVGGDFYDFFFIDDDHLCILMADVSGKGVPAALFMMTAKIILADNARLGKSPAKILEDTNTAICAKNREKMFVTVWLGILEISTGKLTAANAGHEYPIIKHKGGNFELFKDKHGVVVGSFSGMKYKDYELLLEPGSMFFMYTDGVPEANDKDGKMFGLERTIAALNECADKTPEQVLESVHKAVDDFVKDSEQFDDLTMLCVEYKALQLSSDNDSKI